MQVDAVERLAHGDFLATIVVGVCDRERVPNRGVVPEPEE
jgi:hypothetical protein